MKFTVLLTVVCLQVSAAGVAQTISLSEKEAKLEDIFQEVTRQTGYDFLYSSASLSKAGRVNIQVTNASLEEVLSICFKNQALTYTISGRTVVIKLRDEAVASEPLVRRLNDISGQVRNKTGEPMPGVSVAIKNSTRGTTTNNDGRFMIQAAEGDTLIFSFVGFRKIQQRVNTQTNMDVILEEEVTSLGEVVILNAGYFKTTEKLRVGSIVKVEAKDIGTQPVTSPLLSLQGRVAGLEVTPSSGTPGSAPMIRIRGINNLRTTTNADGNYPLFIVDGVPLNSLPVKSVGSSFTRDGFDPLAAIGPDNIESIEVLKDGSATAIYGSRGANGVILITTKQSKRDSPTNVNISFYQGLGSISKFVDMLDTKEYLNMRHEAFGNDKVTPTEINAADLLVWDTTRYTNWQKILLGGTAKITDIQGSIGGGNGNTSFRISGGFHKETMIFPGDFWFTRGSLNSNINHTSVDKRFKVSISTNFGITRNKLFDDANFMNTALYLSPNAPELYNQDGSLNWEVNPSNGLSTWTNPMSSTLKGNESRNSTFISSGMVSYEIYKNVVLQTTLGYTELNGEEISNDPLAAQAPGSIQKIALSYSGTNKRRSWIAEPKINYFLNIQRHTVDFILGSSFQENVNIFQRIEAQYASDDFLGNLKAAQKLTVQSDDYSMYRYISGYFRIGYNYDEKYLIDVTGRRDGSSRFGPGKQFGNFGSVGAGWIFSEEPWIKEKLGFLSFGKLRASYGITGNDQIGDYKFYDLYALGNGYGGMPVLVPDALYNPDFAWEKTSKIESSLKLGFFEDRIMIEGAWYRNRSSNQLVEYSLPATAGFDNVLKNFNATVQNTGLEFVLSATPIAKDKVKWNVSVNLSVPRNKLVRFPGLENSNYAYYFEVGKSLTAQKLYKSTGVEPVSGNYAVLDKDNNGSYDQDDKVFVDRFYPKFYGGLINTIQVRNVELSFLFQFASKNAQRFSAVRPGVGNNQPTWVLQRWQHEGDQTNVAKFSQDLSSASYSTYGNFLQSDGLIEDASFIRLKTMTVSWTLPAKVIEPVRMKSAKVYVQGQNLLTFTGLKNLDPETGSFLPPLRMITIGLNVTF